jgi:hypothetical protein
MAGSVAQVEFLPSKLKVLSSNPSTIKRKKKTCCYSISSWSEWLSSRKQQLLLAMMNGTEDHYVK